MSDRKFCNCDSPMNAANILESLFWDEVRDVGGHRADRLTLLIMSLSQKNEGDKT